MTVVDATAALAGRVRFDHRHAHERFGELWIDGQMRAYCANAGTALVLAAAALGISSETLQQLTQGMGT